MLFLRNGVTFRKLRPLSRRSNGWGESEATGILDGVSSYAIDIRGGLEEEATGAVLKPSVSSDLKGDGVVLTLAPLEAVVGVAQHAGGHPFQFV